PRPPRRTGRPAFLDSDLDDEDDYPEYLFEDTGDDASDLWQLQPVAPSPNVVLPAETGPALLPKPLASDLTPLTEEALADSLERAINFGLSAFVRYPKEGGREPAIYQIIPHWTESRSDQRRAVWAYCHDMKREYCFLLSKISGILLIEAGG